MIYYKKIKNYKICANLNESENISSYIGFVGKYPDIDNLFVINKFRQNKNNEENFKEFFYYFKSKKNKDFMDFFSEKNCFFAVFKYKKIQNLKYQYNKEKCIDAFGKRFKVFENIMIKLYNIINLGCIPSLILRNITKYENILVDNNDIFYFNYELKYFSREKISKKEIFKNISEIISTMFETEISYKYNKMIRIIFQKCELNLYASIPELIIDFKKNERSIRISSFMMYMKNQFAIRKNLISRLAQTVIIPSLLIAFFYLIFSKIFVKKIKDEKEIIIGETVYSIGNQENNKNKKITMDINLESPKQKEKTENIMLSPNEKLEFEDYIIQNGDTFGSLCIKFYGDEKFVSAISSFNSMNDKDLLFPGKILRIPLRSSIIKKLEERKETE
ncbi:MAG: LysM peptidoglycan-binding domain-containing protein [Candidatus Improbicoccus pseudotrichonymphae]|uniref:LysM peptidoglycan-binding domain-containing protein n=1 Tax=Candidatus Improbicoccus pseudotrichonymphae TaxID=3033792 RepID=A0AA48HYY8_9FIRM|nr:MAG: LysM peptidoglycan-binding domain-containing protein [Candidatus Improbicoccus pseudotrichonymphae]